MTDNIQSNQNQNGTGSQNNMRVQSDGQQQNQQIPLNPVSLPHKEYVPGVAQSQTELVSVSPSEQAPEIPKEIEHVLQKVEENPVLTEEHKKVGMELAKEATQVQLQPTGLVHLPMTKDQAMQTIKLHKKISDSVVWLATLVLKQIKISSIDNS